MQLGQTIVKIRKEQGLTQEEFAKQFDVTRQTVSNWENEKSYPDLHTLVKISDLYGISLDILLKGNSNMVKDIDNKVKKQSLYKGIIIALVIFVTALLIFNYYNDKSLSETTLNIQKLKLENVKEIEIYDSQNQDVIIGYEDEADIEKCITALDVESWERIESIEKTNTPKYILKLYGDSNVNDKVNEITIYENGEYATVFISSSGLGVKENYKCKINIAEFGEK